MARRKINSEQRESSRRVLLLLQANRIGGNDSIKGICRLADQWRDQKNFEFLETRNIRRQSVDGKCTTIYYGYYYDLFNFCDDYGLVWPIDGASIQNLITHRVFDSPLANYQYPNPPDQKYWDWFRMARTGLGILTTDDQREMANLPGRKRTGANRGLTQAEVADLVFMRSQGKVVDERNVRFGINQCWCYLDGPWDVHIVKERLGREAVSKICEPFITGKIIFGTKEQLIFNSEASNQNEISDPIFYFALSAIIDYRVKKPTK